MTTSDLSLDYLIAQRFIRIEALGTVGARHGDPADPLYLQVAVTRSDDITDVIEDVIATSSSRSRLWRAGVGKWLFRLNPALYQAGAKYTAHFKFTMTPNNTNVVRQSFEWNTPLQHPITPSHCLLYGGLRDISGFPESGGRIVVEQYSDFVTLNQRTGIEDVVADVFGNWYISLPKGSLVRVVSGSSSDLIQIPTNKDVADIVSLPRFQPRDLIRKDRYGYPLPVTGAGVSV